MSPLEADSNYDSYPRFKELTDYLVGVIKSGSFSGDELRGVVDKAVRLAEAHRLRIPDRSVEHAKGGVVE